MNAKTIKEQTQAVICEKYESYLDGEITKEDWVLYIIDLMENYIKGVISGLNRTLSEDFEDLMQQGRLAILDKIDGYDPYRSKPSTYFHRYILEYTKLTFGNEVTKFYKDQRVKLERVAIEAGYSGLTDPDLKPDTLAVLGDTSLLTVLNTIQSLSYETSSYESACSENANLASPFESPEEKVLKDELNDVIEMQLKRLSPLELYLLDVIDLNPRDPISGMNGDDKAPSYRRLVSAFKLSPELRERFEDELPRELTSKFFEQKYFTAKRRIRNSPKIRRYIPVSTQGDIYEVIEQADNDDIMAALDMGVI